ncbi:MAG: 4Fe-4S dicluster domain-containing protein [candidate division Zixibacteria bacterium]|nr:4Fe-4S dicluster domain-containing protein [candidate division Zixibacteria bacterium]
MEITREIFWNVGSGVRIPVYLLGLIVVIILVYGFVKHIRLWRIGKPETRVDKPFKRILSFLLFGLGHKRILKEPYPGIMHLFLFWGFLVLLIGTAIIFFQEDFTKLFFDKSFISGNFYLIFSFLLDLFGLLAIIGVLLALFRRYVLKPKRLDNKFEDALVLILLFFILLTGFTNEGLRIASTSPDFERWSFVGWQFSKLFSALGSSETSFKSLHLVSWWIHIILAFGFIGYISYSRLLHLISSPLNQFFRSFSPKGEVKPILDIENAETFGVAKLSEFTWKQLFDTDACTRCGRCQDNCPAHLSEKPLSPKKAIQDLKDHLTSQGKSSSQKETSEDQSPPIAGNVITEDELWACTTCGACQEVCPVFVEVVDKVVDLRRYLVLMESKFAPEVKLFFKNMETNYNPWTIGFATRGDWAKDLKVKTLAEDSNVDFLLWIGCAGSFDERNKKVSRTLVNLLEKAEVNFGILGSEEMCCGETARRMGNEYLAQILMQQQIEKFNKYGIKKIITYCPHCFNTFKNEYPQFGGNYQVFHHTEFLWDLIKTKKLKLNTSVQMNVVYHDSCYLGRYNNIYDAPRKLLESIKDIKLSEMKRRKDRSFCCGAGGGRMWMEETLGRRINQMRVDQAVETNASVLATACPYCLTMLGDGIKEKGVEQLISAFDVAELVEKAL